MKKCPYCCAEDILDEALKCKHCGSTITTKAMSTENQSKPFVGKKDKATLKLIGKIILAMIAVVLWYFSIPAIIIWYIWKKTEWNKKKRIMSTALVAIFIPFLSIYHGTIETSIINSQFPKSTSAGTSINIIEPTNNSSLNVATTTIKGKISPVNARLIIGEQRIKTNENGEFTYDWGLPDEENTITLSVITTVDSNENIKVDWHVKRIMTAEEKDEKTKIELTNLIDSLRNFDGSKFRDSVDIILTEVSVFNTMARTINPAISSSNPEIKRLGEQLKSKLLQLQIREFPLLRKAYGKVVSKNMWLDNGEANVYGAGNKTIELVSSAFASNTNIATMQISVEETLKILRFNRINYKWYSGDSEYTYYDLDSIKDSVIRGVAK